MSARPLLSMAEWARRCSRTGARARQVLDSRKIRGARPLYIGPGHMSWAIPEGTPWPVEREAPAAPEGMVDIQTWAKANGRTRDVVLRHVWKDGRPPAGMEKHGGRWYVPEGMPWPWKLGRPRTRGAA